MERTSRIGLLLVVAGGAVGLAPSAAPGVIVTSSAGAGVVQRDVPTGATAQLWVYTESPPQVNGTVVCRVNGIGAGHVPGGAQSTGIWPFNTVYNPTRTTGSLPKAAGSSAYLSSTSVGTARPIGTPTTFAEAQYRAFAGGSTRLRTNTTLNINKWAFARAADPLYYDGGLHSFDVSFDELSIQIAGPQGLAGAGGYFEMNSSIPGMETLVEIGVHAEQDFNSIDDVAVAFVSHPALGFDDDAMSTLLRSMLLVSPGSVTLAGALTFTVSVDDDEPYSVGYSIASDCEGDKNVPAPGALALLTVAGAVTVRRRR